MTSHFHLNKLFAVLLLFLLCAFLPTDQGFDVSVIQRVVIDPGHGGKDPGNIGKYSKEKDITLAIALDLGRLIQRNYPAVKVYYTRLKDEYVSLESRSNLVKKVKADLMISLHCNAAPKNTPNRQIINGTETFIFGKPKCRQCYEVAQRENFSTHKNFTLSSYANYQQKKSMLMADQIENEFKFILKRNSRGVKQADFTVLSNTKIPSVLIELGFLSNPKEEKYLNDAFGQVYLASAVFRAFRKYKQTLEED